MVLTKRENLTEKENVHFLSGKTADGIEAAYCEGYCGGDIAARDTAGAGVRRQYQDGEQGAESAGSGRTGGTATADWYCDPAECE